MAELHTLPEEDTYERQFETAAESSSLPRSQRSYVSESGTALQVNFDNDSTSSFGTDVASGPVSLPLLDHVVTKLKANRPAFRSTKQTCNAHSSPRHSISAEPTLTIASTKQAHSQAKPSSK